MTNKERQQLWISVAIGLITMEAVAGIIWLSFAGHDIPPTLGNVVTFCAGALAGALRVALPDRGTSNGPHTKPPTDPSA